VNYVQRKHTGKIQCHLPHTLTRDFTTWYTSFQAFFFFSVLALSIRRSLAYLKEFFFSLSLIFKTLDGSELAG